MTEAEIEVVLDKIMVLFRYLQEKDVFEEYYKGHLAKRILLQKSLSDDAEKAMISKLKTECGSQFTTNLEGMFKDVQISATLMEQYHQDRKTVESTMGSGWCNLQYLYAFYHDAFEKFKQFYLNKHRGCKISLQPQLGGAELNATFFGPKIVDAATGDVEDGDQPSSSSLGEGVNVLERPGEPRKHILCVSTYQMCILTLFNKRECYSYKEIATETEVPERDLKRAIQSLAMGKASQRVLCRRTAVSAEKSKDIESEDVFSVNDLFTSRLHRVKIQTVLAKDDAEPEHRVTRSKIDENRKHEIEVAIVNIMKTRKKLTHNLLVTECTDKLKHRFLPSPAAIKKRIDSLIEREYLNRDQVDHRIYQYIA